MWKQAETKKCFTNTQEYISYAKHIKYTTCYVSLHVPIYIKFSWKWD